MYENAVAIKLKKNGLRVAQQVSFTVYFEGEMVGEYFADILVEDKIIVEIKCVEQISDVHRAQAINYLKAKLEYERIVL